MAEKELKKLNRRELLQMLLVQCEESERLQQELDELQEQFDAMSESYERLKLKLNVKDERLNQKDAAITALEEENEKLAAEIEELRRTGAAGSAAEAAERIGNIFREAQRAAEQYLAAVQKNGAAEGSGQPKVCLALPDKGERKLPFEQIGKAAGRRKKQPVLRTVREIPAAFGPAKFTVRTGNAGASSGREASETVTPPLAAGSFYG